MNAKGSLADELEAYARRIDAANRLTREHTIRTLGGCAYRNIREIVVALREREERLN